MKAMRMPDRIVVELSLEEAKHVMEDLHELSGPPRFGDSLDLATKLEACLADESEA